MKINLYNLIQHKAGIFPIMSEPISQVEQQPAKKTNWYANINTCILLLSALANSAMVQTFSTINNEITQYLPSVSSTMVSFCSLIFMFSHPFVSVAVNYVLDNYSLKLGISINCIMVCIGLGFRLLILEGFAWVMIGNTLAALTNGFILNCPAKYSAAWYGTKSRVLITSLIMFANCISGAIGAFISPYIVHSDKDIQQGQNQLFKLVKYQAIIIGSIMILNILIFRGSPNSKQILSLKKQPQKQPYIITLKKLFTNKQFIFHLICITCILSSLNSIITNIQLLILPFNYTSKDAGNSLMLSVVAGLLSSVIMSIVSTFSILQETVQRSKKYKYVILILLIFSICSLGVISLGMWVETKWIFYLGTPMFGFCAFPIISGIVEYSCEGLYPVGEATITGLLLAGGQIFSFVFGLIETIILQSKTKQSTIYATLINVGLITICATVFYFTKQNLFRMQFQQKNKQSLLSQKDILKQGHQQQQNS